MNRFLIPLTLEITTANTWLALDSCRSRVASGSSDELLASFLIRQTNLRQIITNEPHLAKVAERLATNRLLEGAIAAVVKFDAQSGQILSDYYLERESDQAIANRLSYSRASVNRLRQEGVEKLATVLFDMETAARQIKCDWLQRSLPPAPYEQFFGRKSVASQLVQALHEQQHNIISISGIGGIGKTALAHQIVRQLIPTLAFDKIIWVTIQSTTDDGLNSPALTFSTLIHTLALMFDTELATAALPAAQQLQLIRQHLDKMPHLIVLDNLEHETDLVYILNKFHGLSSTSKFLITSRSQSTLGRVHNVCLQSLAKSEAVELLTHHASIAADYYRHTVSTDIMEALVKRVTGHPLALQLIADLASTQSEPDLLHFIDSLELDNFTTLYARIFNQKWHQMNDAARTLLLTLPIVSQDGVGQALLLEVSGLQTRDFWPGLNQLLTYALLDIRYSAENEVEYHSHPLTRDFALTLARDQQQPPTASTTIFTTLLKNSISYWRARITSNFLLKDFQAATTLLQTTIRLGLQNQTTTALAAKLLTELYTRIHYNGTISTWLPLYEAVTPIATAHDVQLQFEVLYQSGWFNYYTSNWAKALSQLNAAEHIAHNVLQDNFAIAQCDYVLGWLACANHRYADAKANANRILALYPDTPAPLLEKSMDPLLLLGCAERHLGNSTEALAHLNKSLHYCEMLNDNASKISKFNELIIVHGQLEDIEQAIHCHAQAIELIGQTGRESLRTTIDMQLTRVYLDLGHLDLAEKLLRKSEPNTLAHDWMTTDGAIRNIAWGRLYFKQKQYQAALPHLDEAIAGWRSLKNELRIAEAALYLAAGHHCLGTTAEGVAIATESIATLRKHRNSYRARQLLTDAQNWFPALVVNVHETNYHA